MLNLKPFLQSCRQTVCYQFHYYCSPVHTVLAMFDDHFLYSTVSKDLRSVGNSFHVYLF